MDLEKMERDGVVIIRSVIILVTFAIGFIVGVLI